MLYGRLGKQKVSAFIRRLFTVLQFTISVALIICSIVINRQIYFFRHTDTGNFIQPVLLAILIAIPLARALMNEWLRGFAYRMSLGPWIFAVAGLAALALAMATVGVQAVKAATANPVESLRSAG